MEQTQNLLKHVEAFYMPLAAFLISYLVLWALKNVVLAKLKHTGFARLLPINLLLVGVLDKTKHFFILVLSLYVGFLFFEGRSSYAGVINRGFVIALAVQIIIWGQVLIDSWVQLSLDRSGEDASLKTTMGFVGILLKFAFIVLTLLFVLNNIGVNVSTFIAGLGVGGVAIALATQNILGDLFSSLSIVLDKPFVVGDFVSLGDWLGTIERVGLKTTRIRSLTGEQIVISNSDLLTSRLRNFKRMQERRIVFQLGVTYQTKREDLKRAPEILRQIIEGEDLTRFDRAHFFRYGASSLDFEVVYWVLSPEYLDYANVHERILFKIHEAFEANGLDFAYPTQTIHLQPSAPVTR